MSSQEMGTVEPAERRRTAPVAGTAENPGRLSPDGATTFTVTIANVSDAPARTASGPNTGPDEGGPVQLVRWLQLSPHGQCAENDHHASVRNLKSCTKGSVAKAIGPSWHTQPNICSEDTT